MKTITSEKTKQIRLMIESILQSIVNEDQQDIVYITDIKTFRALFYVEALKLKRVYSVNKSLQGNNLYIVTLRSYQVDVTDRDFQEQEIELSGKWYADAKKVVEELGFKRYCRVKVNDVKEFSKILVVLGSNHTPKRFFATNFEDLDSETLIIRRIS
jgi:adenylate cyclase class IV